jgi:hypothetical protein
MVRQTIALSRDMEDRPRHRDPEFTNTVARSPADSVGGGMPII